MKTANVSRTFVKLWLAIVCVFGVWFVVRAELVDVVAMAFLIMVAVIAMVMAVRGGHRYLAALTATIAAVLVAVMIYCWMQAKERADHFAAEFIRSHACAPSFDELLTSSGDWKRSRVRGHIRADIRFFGASRLVTYQNNGLLRFGLMDETRTVWIPQCKGEDR
ncbi:hypothetical protein [Montanilutibacter psychrotolerans]|uniref:hypothetical protein n=1 Tax=Montanilutibacter psychrotolerans TaxID=1327343 RepID=UPI0011CD4F33|nr:hypothetical protein [Lysobacter psychrotolerans]